MLTDKFEQGFEDVLKQALTNKSIKFQQYFTTLSQQQQDQQQQ